MSISHLRPYSGVDDSVNSTLKNCPLSKMRGKFVSIRTRGKNFFFYFLFFSVTTLFPMHIECLTMNLQFQPNLKSFKVSPAPSKVQQFIQKRHFWQIIWKKTNQNVTRGLKSVQIVQKNHKKTKKNGGLACLNSAVVQKFSKTSQI